jgi:predicted enzyme related to lactoylglutathione lyase
VSQGDSQEAQSANASGVDARLVRPAGISYLHIPADDVRQAAAFYEHVFGWNVHGKDSDRPSFDDGTGHVSGAWMSDQAISREPGLLPYIYVEHIEEAVQRIAANGGEIVRDPYPEGKLTVATFRDPAGNVIGLWHDDAR